MQTAYKTIQTCLAIVVFGLLVACNTNGIFAATKAADKIRLGLYIDKGAHAHELLKNTLAQDPLISLHLIDGSDIQNGCLENLDVLFMPGGSGKEESFSLGEQGKHAVYRFIRQGGVYVGVCAGCYLASCCRPQYLGLIPMTTVDKEHWRRGKAVLSVEFTQFGMQVFGVTKPIVQIKYHNGPALKIFENYKQKVIPLSFYRSEVVAKNGTPGLMINTPAMVLAQYGEGLVLGISPHPEATAGLTNLEPNAIHWLYAHRHNKTVKPVSIILNEPTKETNFAAPKNDQSFSNAIYSKAEEVLSRAASSRYRHLHKGPAEQVQVDEAGYSITTDCSGFVSYILNSVAPQQYQAIARMSNSVYPHAANYAQFFCSLRWHTNSGWLAINDFKDLEPGDIIAWQKTGQSATKGNGTGHVMIVANKPSPVENLTCNGSTLRSVNVCVIDSSSVEHFPPQTLPANEKYRNGIGKGVIRFILDQQDKAIGFWEGTYSHEKQKYIKGPSYSSVIGFARAI